MAPGDIYVNWQEGDGWTVQRAETGDMPTKELRYFGSQYHQAIQNAKKQAKQRKTGLVVNYKDGRTGRYQYGYNEATGELENR